MNFDAGFPLFITHKTVHEKYNEKYELTKDRLILVHAEFKVDKNLCEEEKKSQIQHVIGWDALLISIRKSASIHIRICLFCFSCKNFVESETLHEHSSSHHVSIHIFS
jgi:hypothetical protein